MNWHFFCFVFVSVGCLTLDDKALIKEGKYQVKWVEVSYDKLDATEFENLEEASFPDDVFSLDFEIDLTNAHLSISTDDSLSFELKESPEEDWEWGCPMQMKKTIRQTFELSPGSFVLGEVEFSSAIVFADECVNGEVEVGVATIAGTQLNEDTNARDLVGDKIFLERVE